MAISRKSSTAPCPAPTGLCQTEDCDETEGGPMAIEDDQEHSIDEEGSLDDDPFITDDVLAADLPYGTSTPIQYDQLARDPKGTSVQ